MAVPLIVNGAPVIHILHSVIDSLGEGRDVVCILQDCRDFFKVKDEAVHPDWTGKHVLVIFDAVL